MTLQRYMRPSVDELCEREKLRRNISDGTAYAVFKDDQMLSVCEGDNLRYMRDEVETIGVRTHPDYRRLGYAKAALSRTTKAVFGLGKVPLYSLRATNLASLYTGESVGYRTVASTVIFRLQA